MRFPSRALLATLIACLPVGLSVTKGQDPAPRDKAPKLVRQQPATMKISYFLQFTEFRLPESDKPAMSNEDILQAYRQRARENQLEVIETLRFTALEQHESLVQIGRRANIPVGSVAIGANRAPVQRTQAVEIGTLVKATAKAQEEKILLEFAYQSSRLTEPKNDDGVPDVTTTQFDTTLLLDAETPVLVGGSSAGASTYLVVEVREKK